MKQRSASNHSVPDYNGVDLTRSPRFNSELNHSISTMNHR